MRERGIDGRSKKRNDKVRRSALLSVKFGGGKEFENFGGWRF